MPRRAARTKGKRLCYKKIKPYERSRAAWMSKQSRAIKAECRGERGSDKSILDQNLFTGYSLRFIPSFILIIRSRKVAYIFQSSCPCFPVPLDVAEAMTIYISFSLTVHIAVAGREVVLKRSFLERRAEMTQFGTVAQVYYQAGPSSQAESGVGGCTSTT